MKEVENPPRKRASPSKSKPAAKVAEQKSDPELDALVREIIDRVADKWTMLAIEALGEHGRTRFTPTSSNYR